MGGDAKITNVGNKFTLLDLQSVSALWSGSSLLIVVALF